MSYMIFILKLLLVSCGDFIFFVVNPFLSNWLGFYSF